MSSLERRLANQGITDRDELARHAEALGGRGIRTSCLGIGDDYDERLLSGISSSSGGHFYHIETAVQIPDILTSEIGEALEVVARDVIVAVRPPAGVSVTTLNSYRVRPPAGGSFVVQLGDLTARQEVSLVFALKFPAAVEGEVASVLFSVSDAAGALSAPESDVAWTFAEHRSNDTQPRNVAVDRAGALSVEVFGVGDIELEVWAATSQLPALEQALKRPATITSHRVTEDEPASRKATPKIKARSHRHHRRRPGPFVLVGRTGTPSSPPISFGALAHPHEVKGKDQASLQPGEAHPNSRTSVRPWRSRMPETASLRRDRPGPPKVRLRPSA